MAEPEEEPEPMYVPEPKPLDLGGGIVGFDFGDFPDAAGPMTGGLCQLCTYLKDYDSRTCGAFPGGIPDKFWFGDADHTVAIEGDHGITFECK